MTKDALQSSHTGFSLQCSLRIVAASMNNLAIPAAGLLTKSLILLNYEDLSVVTGYVSSYCQPNNPGSNYGNVSFIHAI